MHTNVIVSDQICHFVAEFLKLSYSDLCIFSCFCGAKRQLPLLFCFQDVWNNFFTFSIFWFTLSLNHPFHLWFSQVRWLRRLAMRRRSCVRSLYHSHILKEEYTSRNVGGEGGVGIGGVLTFSKRDRRRWRSRSRTSSHILTEEERLQKVYCRKDSPPYLCFNL